MFEIIDLLFSIGALAVVNDGIGGYAKEPGGEGRAAPFVAGKIGKGFVEDFGSKVLGGGTLVDATEDEEVDAIEMKLVEHVEFRRVRLRGFNEQALVGALRRGFLCRTSDGHHGLGYSNCRGP